MNTLRVRNAALAVAFLSPLSVSSNTQAQAADLFLSEYIEASSNNKAIEIYNGTGAAVDLAAGVYTVEMYFNATATVGLTHALTGTVASGDVFVLSNPLADAPGDRHPRGERVRQQGGADCRRPKLRVRVLRRGGLTQPFSRSGPRRLFLWALGGP